MKKFRILTLASVFALSGLMTGCDLFDSDESNGNPTVVDFRIAASIGTNDQTSDIDISQVAQATVYGKYSDDKGIKAVNVTIKDPTGATLDASKIAKTGSAPGGKEWNSNLNGSWKLSLTGLCNGTYTATATVTDEDGATGSASTSFKISGGSTCATSSALTSATVTLGSNNNNDAGSSLDADAMVSYKISGVTTALQGEIDAYYAYSATDKTDKFFSPAQAKVSKFDGIINWTVSNSVALYDLTSVVATEAAFNALTTQEAIDALFTGKSAAVSVNAENGTVVGIVTSKGAKRIIRVNAITPGAAGTVTIKGYK